KHRRKRPSEAGRWSRTAPCAPSSPRWIRVWSRWLTRGHQRPSGTNRQGPTFRNHLLHGGQTPGPNEAAKSRQTKLTVTVLRYQDGKSLKIATGYSEKYGATIDV